MNKKEQLRALRALLKSKEHWQKMMNDPLDGSERPSSSQCACCQQYRNMTSAQNSCSIFESNNIRDSSCGECPIKKFTGFENCNKTPYSAAVSALMTYRHNQSVNISTGTNVFYEREMANYKKSAIEACESEINFLDLVINDLLDKIEQDTETTEQESVNKDDLFKTITSRGKHQVFKQLAVWASNGKEIQYQAAVSVLSMLCIPEGCSETLTIEDMQIMGRHKFNLIDMVNQNLLAEGWQTKINLYKDNGII